MCVPFATTVEFQPAVQDDVPVAATQVPPSTDSDTDETPTLSELVPLTDTWPATVAEADGEEIEMIGLVVSVVQVLPLHRLAAEAELVTDGATAAMASTEADTATMRVENFT